MQTSKSIDSFLISEKIDQVMTKFVLKFYPNGPKIV